MAERNNQKWTPELGAMLCDRLTQNPSITAAAKFFGLVPMTIYLWARGSAKDQAADIPLEQSKWAIRWPQDPEGETPLVFLHEGIFQSQKLFRAIAETQLRALLADPNEGGGQIQREVLDGTGRPVFEVDTLRAAHALEMDDFDWQITYGPNARRDDVFKRDENGALIPKKIRDPLPSQTLIHLMRSVFGDTFNPSDRREVDTRLSVETLVITEKKKPQSQLRDDLEARLAAIRADPNRASARPNAPVAMIGTGHNDPPEHVTGLADDAPPRLADHPRAYFQPLPPTPKAAPPNYARPNRSLDVGEQVGRGVPPPGGVKVS